MGHLRQDDIKSARYEGAANKRQVLWDDDPRGLGLRIYPSGLKSFIVAYRDRGGSKRLATIGDFGTFTLDQARTAAREVIRQAELGADVLKVKRAHRAAPTFGDLADAYLQRHATRKRTGEADKRRLAYHVLPLWQNRKALDITRLDVADLIRSIGETRKVAGAKRSAVAERKAKRRPDAKPGTIAGRPYEANRTLAMLSVIFNKGIGFGILPTGHPNPCVGVDRYREQKRDRWVTPAELPKLAQAIDAEADPYARAALWLYLLTGCRKTELLGARRSDYDRSRAVLHLPVTKSGQPHEVPLSAPAVALLDALPVLEGNPYIFPGRKEGSHLESIRGPWDRVRMAAGVADVRLHDLRRTVGSWLAQSGNSLHLIGRVLNHAHQSTTAIYARFAQDHVRDALEQHAVRLMGAAGKLPAAEVHDISDARQRSKK